MMMKKRISAILLILVLLLTGCGGVSEQTTEAGTGEAATVDATEAVTEAAATGLDIYADGDTAYKLIRPDSASATLTSAFTSLRNRIRETTGKEITLDTDWLKKGTEAPEYEILVGNTSRPESSSALAKLDKQGWIVCVEGKKIVINATKDKLLEEAVEYFCENYISADKKPIPEDLCYMKTYDAKTSGTVSILFVGNSLTQDGIAYLPYLLENYYPGIDFKFYMWYIGGATLADSYSRFTSESSCDIFSVAENTSTWTNSQKTMSWILKNYTFDIVCMQEYFNYKSDYYDSDLTVWNNCHDYIVSNYAGSNSLEFISLFHAPKRDRADSIYNLTVSANQTILSKTVADDIIPVGIAVKLALGTELSSLGDQGGLSPDGTHCQEGLPCLVQTYTALIWLLDRLEMDTNIDKVDAKITKRIYAGLNIPGANLGTGIITGTDEQIALAKEIAVKAFAQSQKLFGE